jgi:hypothetical protein
MKLLKRALHTGTEWLYNKIYPDNRDKPEEIELFDGDSKVLHGTKLTRSGNRILVTSEGKEFVIFVGSKEKIVGFRK